jgi:diamine N-acetyltransferase
MAKRCIPPIAGRRLCLRLLTEADLPMTLAWRNQAHIRRWFVHSEVITAEQHRRWYGRYCQRDDDFVFVIEETKTLRKPVGQVALYNILWAQRRAEYGRLLIGEPAAVGIGLAQEATKLLLSWAFSQLALRQIELAVFRTNLKAIALYRACGFREAGEHDGLQHMVCTAG